MACKKIPDTLLIWATWGWGVFCRDELGVFGNNEEIFQK